MIRVSDRSGGFAAVKVVLGSAVIAGFAIGGYYGCRWITTTPSLAVAKIDVYGMRRALPSEHLEAAGLELGKNIVLLDLPAAEQRLETGSWIRHAVVERVWPRGIKVRVAEHEPAALAQLDGAMYYVDRTGFAFKRLSPGETVDLPILISREPYSTELRGLFREALDALEVYRSAGLDATETVSQILVDPVYGPTFLCGAEAFAVKLGFGQVPEKIGRLEALYRWLATERERPEVIRLNNRVRPGWVAVELARKAQAPAPKATIGEGNDER